jgi:hypothetical protein
MIDKNDLNEQDTNINIHICSDDTESNTTHSFEDIQFFLIESSISVLSNFDLISLQGVPTLKRAEVEVACEYFSNIIGVFSPKCIMYKGTLSSGVEIAVISSLVKSSKEWSKNCEFQFRNKVCICNIFTL